MCNKSHQAVPSQKEEDCLLLKILGNKSRIRGILTGNFMATHGHDRRCKESVSFTCLLYLDHFYNYKMNSILL